MSIKANHLHSANAKLIDWETVTDLAVRALATQTRDDWDSFWHAITPHMETMIRKSSVFRNASRKSEIGWDIFVDAFEKLQEGNNHRLRGFFASELANRLLDDQGRQARAMYFRNWLQRVVCNVAYDYIRSIPEYIRRRKSAPAGKSDSNGQGSDERWRVIQALTTGKSVISNRIERVMFVHDLLSFLDGIATLPERRAVELFEQGARLERIASALGLSSESQARRLLDRARDRVAYRPAIELWCTYHTPEDIASALGLKDENHAIRVIKAAKACLRRHFAQPESSR